MCTYEQKQVRCSALGITDAQMHAAAAAWNKREKHVTLQHGDQAAAMHYLSRGTYGSQLSTYKQQHRQSCQQGNQLQYVA
jgi:hypothetical protein